MCTLVLSISGSQVRRLSGKGGGDVKRDQAIACRSRTDIAIETALPGLPVLGPINGQSHGIPSRMECAGAKVKYVWSGDMGGQFPRILSATRDLPKAKF